MSPDEITNEAARVLLARHPDARFRKEWGVLRHKARADLAMISGSRLHLVECKSSDDDLRRLAGQVATYSRAGDFCYLFAVPKLARQALATLPPWWGVWSVGIAGTAVIREPLQNLERDGRDLLRLLWKDELINIARKHKLKVGGTRAKLISRIHQVLTRYGVAGHGAELTRALADRKLDGQPVFDTLVLR